MACDAARSSEEGFTSARAARVMAAACRSAALSGTGAELIRFGENVRFRLASAAVVVRIARGPEWLSTARKEVYRAGWPSRVLEDVEQPLSIEGHPVTFWHLIEEGDRKATYGELGAALRGVHSLTLPAGLELPQFEPFDKWELRLEMAPIPEDDKAFLRKRQRELPDKCVELSFETPKGPFHGDGHVQNLMVNKQGEVILVDFEVFCFDHPKCDLMVTEMEHHSIGWQTDEQYSDLVSAYGRDLYEWDGYRTLRGIQEFDMTTWLM